jgi:hypothetical protein
MWAGEATPRAPSINGLVRSGAGRFCGMLLLPDRLGTQPPAHPRKCGTPGRFQLYDVDALHGCLRRTRRFVGQRTRNGHDGNVHGIAGVEGLQVQPLHLQGIFGRALRRLSPRRELTVGLESLSSIMLTVNG